MSPTLSFTLLELVGWCGLGAVIIMMIDYMADLRGTLEGI